MEEGKRGNVHMCMCKCGISKCGEISNIEIQKEKRGSNFDAREVWGQLKKRGETAVGRVTLDEHICMWKAVVKCNKTEHRYG